MHQTSDPAKYYDMLALTSRTTREFCLRHDIGFEMFVGYRRGYFPWQAERNRILALRDWLAAGRKGWFGYLDADAYIHDLSFDLRAYLGGLEKTSMIMTHGASQEPHDVNNGVFFINMGHPDGIEIARLWVAAEALATDAALRRGEKWHSVRSSQTMLQAILRTRPELCRAIRYEQRKFINSPGASFIRQILRADEGDFDKRLSLIRHQVEAVMQSAGAVVTPLTAPVAAAGEPEVHLRSTFLSHFPRTGPALSRFQARTVANTIRSKAPGCNLLVFGIGEDAKLWLSLNRDGRTVFLDSDAAALDKMRAAHPDAICEPLETHGLTVATSLAMGEADIAGFPLPAVVEGKAWDVILVDGPQGYKPDSPGRALPIFWASRLARNATDVFVHDYERPLEARFADVWLRHGRRTNATVIQAAHGSADPLLFWSMGEPLK